ncbi:MAG: BTAD domain-containing putative transcriptional regulator [Gemmatimonadales bacterium]
MIRLQTFGSLDLRGSDDQELRAVLAQPKRAALLIYLALATPRRPHSRDSLLALFWPEQDTEHARNALNQSVYFIRGWIGADTVVSNGDGLQLDWKDFWCDAAAFEAALHAGKPAEAVALYRGDLLEGFHVADAPDFTEWLEVERGRLAHRYTQAVETVAEERDAAGDFGGAVGEWQRLAARDLYNSRVALRLMKAMVAAGDPAGAVQHARIHETLLREELGIAPDAEVVAFVRYLQSASPEPIGPPDTPEFPAARVIADSPEIPLVRVPALGPADSVPAGARRRRTALVAVGLVAFTLLGAVAVRNGVANHATPPIRSLAVLPLENLSGDSSQQSFTDGLHDVLITELARYPELSVISRTSVLQYRGTKKPLPVIARELKVDGLVEGAVSREGGRVRLTAQLVHGPSDRHVWAHRYERDLRDILLLQGELAEAIAREVRVAARPSEQRHKSPVGATDSAPQELQLRELYLRGHHAEISLSLVGIQAAKAYYQLSLELDSTFALGYAGLATTYWAMADYGFAPIGPALDSSRMMARRAMALDSTIPESRRALAVALANAGEFEAAEQEFKSAIDVGPSNAEAHYHYSILLVALGRGEDALREAQHAAQLDPFGPRGHLAMQRYATWLLTGQRPYLKQPVSGRRPILKTEPGEPWARARDAIDYAEQGGCVEARSAIRKAQALVQTGNLEMLKYVAMVNWWCGERRPARALLAKMKQRTDAVDNGFQIAWVHALFGEKDSAFVWLERQRWTVSKLSALSASRWMDPLRSDPRFPQLLRKLGLRSS